MLIWLETPETGNIQETQVDNEERAVQFSWEFLNIIEF